MADSVVITIKVSIKPGKNPTELIRKPMLRVVNSWGGSFTDMWCSACRRTPISLVFAVRMVLSSILRILRIREVLLIV
jgi:hypothetical protein